MSKQTRSFELEPLSPELSPGLSDYLKRWWTKDAVPRPAQAPLHERIPEPRSGPAWSDASFQDELEIRHRRLGAEQSSLDSLAALADGAPCVITGQQPAVFGGALYCAWKLAGAVGLARELSVRWGRKVVPVYWCGSDDSDFEEVRRIWVHGGERGAWQAGLPPGLAEPGSMVGSVRGDELIALGESLREFLGSGMHPRLDEQLVSLDPGFDLADRVSAGFLRLFAEAGLVVVDARSGRLLELAKPLFTRYVGQHARVADAVDARGEELERMGLARPLHPSATGSALFAVKGSKRFKLDPAGFSSALESEQSLAPSVLLRPLMQDELLSPAAAVLGPSELHYHAQLAPAYEILGVEAAAPAPRPHVCLLPAGVPLPEDAESRGRLLAGGELARRVLAEDALPREWRASTERLSSELVEALERWRESLGDAVDDDELASLHARLEKGVDDLRRRLVPRALERDPKRRRLFDSVPDWLAVRGVPQERAYAAWMGWQWLGSGYPEFVREVGARYAEDLLQARPALYCAMLPEESA